MSVGATGLRPDAAFAGAAPLDTSKDFLPFGPQADLGASFLLACDEAFKRSGSKIDPHDRAVRVQRPDDDQRPALTWEYSTGEGSWKAFSPADQELFQKNASPADPDRTVTFDRPSGWRRRP